MKKTVSLLLALTLMLTAGCSAPGQGNSSHQSSGGNSSGKSGIPGTYYAISCSDESGTDYDVTGMILILERGGKGTFEIRGNKEDISWKASGNEFSFTDPDGSLFEGYYSSGMITGSYGGYKFLFTSDESLASSYQDTQGYSGQAADPGGSHGSGNGSTGASGGMYFTAVPLYEQSYGIRTAMALVPYGWDASVTVEWGMLSTSYPALATVTMTSPDGDATIQILSTVAFLQMSRNGQKVPEGSYLDYYNVFLDYRDAGAYNDYILGLTGMSGSVLYRQGPTYEYQLELNGAANSLLSALSVGSVSGVECAGTTEKTTYFITSGDAYEVDVLSTVIMARTQNGLFDTYLWRVPVTAVFAATGEEAYADYSGIFDLVVANTSFTGEFQYVVQRNAQYLNDMIHDYLMEQIYSPSSSDIMGWDSEYTETESDRFVNAWCDVIKEQNEYVTSEGASVKIPTQYDYVYQNGDTIYMGDSPVDAAGWQQLEVSGY